MDPNMMTLVADIAVGVGALSLVVLTVAVVRFLLELRARSDQMSAAVERHLGPLSERASDISDNVEFITRAVRTDVERLNASVKALTGRLQQASDRMEERIEEFNALMEVVQSEAEGVFLDTAATVRGVREGARAIGRGRPGRNVAAALDETGEDGETEDVAEPDEHATPVTPNA